MDMKGWVRHTRQYLDARPAEEMDRAYTGAEIKTVMEAAISALVNELAVGGDLSLSDLGRLAVETRQPRTVHSRLHGQQATYRVKARRRVVFRMSRRLKSRVDVPTPVTTNPNSPTQGKNPRDGVDRAARPDSSTTPGKHSATR